MDQFDRQFRGLLAEAADSPLGLARGFVQFGPLKVYMRIGRRALPDGTAPVFLQLANATVNRVEHERRGHFSAMFARILELTDLPIYAESVTNIGFGDALLRRGFVTINDPLGGALRDMVLLRAKLD